MKKRILSITLVLLFTLISVVTVVADAPEGSCGSGEIQSALQALPVGFHIVNEQLNDIKMAGLGEGVANCQYRFFGPGTTSYRASDLILGGVVYFWDYKKLGMTRQEAIDDILRIEDRVWLGPEGGPLVEQELTYTSFKNFNHPDLGVSVYQQRALIIQLEPGVYESYWESYYDGELEASNTVTLIVEP